MTAEMEWGRSAGQELLQRNPGIELNQPHGGSKPGPVDDSAYGVLQVEIH